MVRNLELRAASNGIARNEILFVGDDMGVSTVTDARIMEGQFLDGAGEENALRSSGFPTLLCPKPTTSTSKLRIQRR